MMEGFSPAEHDKVALALLEMFGGFTSMRQSEAEAIAKVESMGRLLADFPAWAIEKACLAIRLYGVWRNGKFDQQWPPNESELVKAIREKLRLYGDQHRSAVALLEALVDVDDKPKHRYGGRNYPL